MNGQSLEQGKKDKRESVTRDRGLDAYVMRVSERRDVRAFNRSGHLSFLDSPPIGGYCHADGAAECSSRAFPLSPDPFYLSPLSRSLIIINPSRYRLFEFMAAGVVTTFWGSCHRRRLRHQLMHPAVAAIVVPSHRHARQRRRPRQWVMSRISRGYRYRSLGPVPPSQRKPGTRPGSWWTARRKRCVTKRDPCSSSLFNGCQ